MKLIRIKLIKSTFITIYFFFRSLRKFDELDMKLLFELTKDGNVSVPQLSKKLGINPSVLYSRIKRLLRKKLIKKFTIDIDDSLLGIGVKATVGINRDPKFKIQIHKKNFVFVTIFIKILLCFSWYHGGGF